MQCWQSRDGKAVAANATGLRSLLFSVWLSLRWKTVAVGGGNVTMACLKLLLVTSTETA